MEQKFYICEHCGNIITFVEDKDVPVMCCGEKMTELIPGAVDGAVEKHVPMVERQGSKVTVRVGSVAHPMEEKHYIQWISLTTNQGTMRKYLKPGEKPGAEFALTPGEELVAVYAYCNIHGLWEA